MSVSLRQCQYASRELSVEHKSWGFVETDGQLVGWLNTVVVGVEDRKEESEAPSASYLSSISDVSHDTDDVYSRPTIFHRTSFPDQKNPVVLPYILKRKFEI